VLTKGIVGAIPFVGALAAEVIGTIIPNQRLERIERLLTLLDAKLNELPRPHIEARFREPEFVDLLEDGMQQASRALDSERIAYIAALLKNSLADEELKRLQDKRLLAILGELNEVELLLLTSYIMKNQHDVTFQERHKSALRVPPAFFGADPEALDQAALHEEYRNHLTRLGLLRQRYKRPKRGELPEFDDRTGMVKATGRELTALGRLLLRRIDVLAAGES
jgi:hypothetical protein